MTKFHLTSVLFLFVLVSSLTAQSLQMTPDPLQGFAGVEAWSFGQSLKPLSESGYFQGVDFEPEASAASQHKRIGLILMIGGVCLGVGGTAWMVSELESTPYTYNYSTTTLIGVYGGAAVASVGITATVIGFALFMQGSRGE